MNINAYYKRNARYQVDQTGMSKSRTVALAVLFLTRRQVPFNPEEEGSRKDNVIGCFSSLNWHFLSLSLSPIPETERDRTRDRASYRDYAG